MYKAAQQTLCCFLGALACHFGQLDTVLYYTTQISNINLYCLLLDDLDWGCLNNLQHRRYGQQQSNTLGKIAKQKP